LLQRLKAVEGTDDATPAPVEHVRVDHRRAHIGVAEQLLHRTDVVPRLEQVCSERMAQRVRRGGLGDAGVPHCLAHGALEGLIAHMMATNDTSTWILRCSFTALVRYSCGRAITMAKIAGC